jgi:hypothetical protein
MAVYATTSQLLTLLQQEVGDVSPSSATTTRLLNLLNSVYAEVLEGGGVLNENDSNAQKTNPIAFSWLPRTKESIIALPKVDLDITVTNGSATITLGTVPAASIANYRALIDGTYYTITAHTGGVATATVDSIVIADSGTYTSCYWKVDYALATTNILRPLDKPIIMTEKESKLDIIPIESLSNDVTFVDRPSAVAFIIATNGTGKIRFNRIPDRQYKVEVSLLEVQDVLDLIGSDPILPAEKRKLLVHFAAYYHLIKRDDSRALLNLKLAKSMYESMKTGSSALHQSFGQRLFARVIPMRIRSRR